MSVDRYKRLHATWIEHRSDYDHLPGGMPDHEEARWAERLDEVWDELSISQREIVREWLARQAGYRRQHNMDERSGELTPEERGWRQFACRYQLIVAEDDKATVFQIYGRDVQISKGLLLAADEHEHMLWLTREDAEALGLIH